MMSISALVMNPLFWAILIALVVSQGSKVCILVFKKGQKFVLEDFFITGNMPSAHCAIVTALVVILYLTEGFTSVFFATVVFAAIVIRDAVGVRRTVGEESKVLTKVVAMLKKKFHFNVSHKIHQNLGHQPLEVIVGILVGLGSAVVVHLYFISY
jgi:uncharacterized protein